MFLDADIKKYFKKTLAFVCDECAFVYEYVKKRKKGNEKKQKL